jgi:ABC-type transport system involved in multi-copper enzyme maturation permease subunit
MIRAMIWKEWREHRWKYAAFWLALNLPILLVALSVALSNGARAPFSDLSDSTVVKYLGVALFAESGLIATLFLIVSGFFAVATFSPELQDGSVFFLYEQPFSPWKYVAFKVLNGLVHTAAAVTFAVLFAPLAAYVLMLLGGKVTLAGSLPTLLTVMVAAGRAAVWCSLLSIAAFSGSALITAILPRWWLATAGSLVAIVLFNSAGDKFFDFIQPAFDGVEQVSVGIGFGSPQWLTISRALPLQNFAPWRALPLLTALLLTLAFGAATGWVYARKELK